MSDNSFCSLAIVSIIDIVLRSQVAFFSDLAASYDLPGLADIAQTTLLAIEQNPDQILDIAIIALSNFHQARADILAGDRDRGGTVFPDLLNWVQTTSLILDSHLDPENEIFDHDSFFFESVDDVSDITMAFSPEWVANSQPVKIELVTQEKDQSQIVPENYDESAEISAVEETVTPFSEVIHQTEELILDADYYLAAKSPVEEILQSIAVLTAPLVSFDVEDIPIEKTTTQNVSNLALPSIKVAIEQLDRLNHNIGELLIKENQKNLQYEQLQLSIGESFQIFRLCQQELFTLGDWSEEQKKNYKRQKRKQQQNQVISDYQKLNTKLLQISFSNKNNLSDLLSPHSPNTLTQFDALEMDVYSDLDFKLQTITENMTLLGEKIENIERILLQSHLDINKRKQLLDRIQKEVLQARMLPLSTVFNRFPRHLQQMVATYQKPAKLKNIGGEVNIDKAIAEKLYEPLLHLLRNAYDHGLETPEIRREQGKSEVGKITIRAYNQGNQTLIEVEDDGRGIDLEKVLIKAIEKNLVNPAHLDSLSETEITNFLFQPGFSTASEITDLSGRGVGLNVVESQIKAFDGKISIRSKLKEGTTFILKLPLNLTTARLLLCESQKNIYGILATEIAKVIAPLPEQIFVKSSIKGDTNQSFFRYQNKEEIELIPIINLEELISYPYPIIHRDSSFLETLVPKKQQRYIQSLLLIETEEIKICLQVTKTLNEQELVIKSFNKFVTLSNYIQGYTVLGDGNLSLVINPKELVTYTSRQSSLKTRQSFGELSPLSVAETTATNTKDFSYRQPTILVVEDSIVQRQSLVMMLTKNDYKVIQAANGQEAIANLEQNSEINLIISDVEMPVINGFELLSYCQNNPKLAQIPIIMITTRSGQKHRELASSLSAKAYLTKPANEKEIIKNLSELISF